MNATLQELAHDVRKRQEEIVDRWKQLCEADAALNVVDRLTRIEFRDGIPKAIDELCRALGCGSAEGSSEEIQSDAAEHGHHRWKQGFTLGQLIRDWGKLNQVLIGMFEEFFNNKGPEAAADRRAALDCLAQFVTEASTGSIRRFDELRRAEAVSMSDDLKFMKAQFDGLTEARGQLLREAAHDIRGGLSAVAMASEVLKLSSESKGSNESFADILDALDKGVESVKQILNSLLDLSRLESGAEQVELLKVDIAEVLRRLAEEYRPAAQEKALTLSTSGPDELYVETDPEKVRRIAQNLIMNALQHTTSGAIRLSWTLEDPRWIMRIADTGPGIQDVVGSPVAQEMDSPSHPVLVSNPPKVGGYRGEGIGLTIVKRLCTMLGAGVSLESKVGQGTTFTVEFPASYEPE